MEYQKKYPLQSRETNLLNKRQYCIQLLQFIFTGYALNCITCNSAINSECGDPFTANQEKYLAKCEPEETYCGKTVSTENVRTRKYTVHFGYNEIQYDKTPLVMYLYSPGNACIKLSQTLLTLC